ncbi:MAG: type I methionyl aminopeptidase [Bacteroidetes bacterium]|nr:type I methionyl aminopeptidase [Bacteroidota bacterium]
MFKRTSTLVKSEEEINIMRASGKITSDVLKLISSFIKVGVTTKELDDVAFDFIKSAGAFPAFKNYGHDKNNLYPATLCVSINDEVVHGIPSDRKLQEGDIVSVDVGVEYRNYFSDSASTFKVGKVSSEKEHLMNVTKESLEKGIEKAIVGNHIGDISHAIQSFVEKEGFSVVRDLVGHGVGRELHEEPQIPNFGKPGDGIELTEGMTLAIEPMINAGSYKVIVGDDGWTIKTKDGKPSAHFEHTIVVGKNKAEILT